MCAARQAVKRRRKTVGKLLRRLERRVLAAKLNTSSLNQASRITEISKIWVAHNYIGVDIKMNRQNDGAERKSVALTKPRRSGSSHIH